MLVLLVALVPAASFHDVGWLCRARIVERPSRRQTSLRWIPKARQTSQARERCRGLKTRRAFAGLVVAVAANNGSVEVDNAHHHCYCCWE
uniref:Putative secreted protein n=1 Tax=Anopheles triannulatus TaxID=58253 RepID=A0A2M4B6L1_9DIPT